jgi:hypothetical protein
MKMGFSGEDLERRSVSMVQAFVVSDCLKVGVNFVTTQIPLKRLTRVGEDTTFCRTWKQEGHRKDA